MARGPIPYLVLKTNGDATPGAVASINVRGGGAATLYVNETGGATAANPATTDSEGRISGWLDEGSYDITVSGAGIVTVTRALEVLKGGGSFSEADGSVTTAKILDGAVTKPKMAAGSVVFRTVHSFTIGGGVRVPSGELDYIPPFRVHKTATQGITLPQISYRLNNGSVGSITVTFSIEKNGTPLTGFTSLVASSPTWATATPTPITLADNDQLALVVTAALGAPQNFSVTLVLEHSN